MSNRRSFFKSLIGLIVAPKVVEAIPTRSVSEAFKDWQHVVLITPHVLAKDLISVQPLDAPSGVIYEVSIRSPDSL